MLKKIGIIHCGIIHWGQVRAGFAQTLLSIACAKVPKPAPTNPAFTAHFFA